MKLRQDRHIRCSNIAKKYLKRSAWFGETPKAERAMLQARKWARIASELGQEQIGGEIAAFLERQAQLSQQRVDAAD